MNITEVACPKCNGSDVREKLMAVDCREAHWDGIEREGQFWIGKLWAQPGFRNSEELKDFIVDTPSGTFLKAQYCNSCETGFITDEMLDAIKWDKRKNMD